MMTTGIDLASYRNHVAKMVATMESEDEYSTSNAFRDRLWNLKRQLHDIDEFAKSKFEKRAAWQQQMRNQIDLASEQRAERNDA